MCVQGGSRGAEPGQLHPLLGRSSHPGAAGAPRLPGTTLHTRLSPLPLAT